MKEAKVDFDLSVLSFKELIEVYNQMTEFMQFLHESKVDIEEAKKDE